MPSVLCEKTQNYRILVHFNETELYNMLYFKEFSHKLNVNIPYFHIKKMNSVCRLILARIEHD